MENPQSGSSWCTAPRLSAPVAKRRRVKCSYVKKSLSFDLYGTRLRRRQRASHFRREHNMSSVFRYHIQAGAPLCSRRATSVGVTWVAVQGIDSICVVARSNEMRRLQQDMMPHVEINSDYFPSRFWNTIISEVEDIAAPRRRSNKSSKKPFSVGPSGESRQILGKCSKRRFGVVSMIEDTNEASSAEYDAEKAIEFLREEMESGAVFTFDKTTQTAISAFQHLFRQEFEADEIRAFVLKKDEPIGRELKQTRKEDFDIEECLAIINGA